MDTDISLLASIVENAPLGVVVTSIEGTIIFVNPNAEKLFSSENAVVIGSSIDKFLVFSDSSDNFRSIHTQLKDSRQVHGSVHISHAGVDDRMCGFQAFLIARSDETPLCVFTLLDSTEDIRKTEKIVAQNLEITRMNSELIRSNSELQKVSELKSNFLSIASHELKTPLTTIKGYSDIIMDSMKVKIDPGVFRMIENINRAADRLHHVVNDILDITRIEQKRLRLHIEPINLANIVKESIDEISNLGAHRHVTFNCTADGHLDDFFGDQMRMHQALVNIFSNAVKFSPDNSSVDVEITEEHQNQFHIIVRDRGIGIDKADQKSIFDPFFEIGNANRHSSQYSKFMGGGTGLGLSIVRGIVECHGGRIWVESDGIVAGSFPGSEFHIVLPLKSKSSYDEETKVLLISRRKMVPVENDEDDYIEEVDKKPEILIIDSDREATEIVLMILEPVFDVSVAESGETGLQIAFERKPSLILMDTRLPGLDGYRICRILRSQDETRGIPIAIFSAHADDDEIQKGFSCGADEFIVKPFSGKDLVEKVWRVLMKKKEEATFR